MKNNINDIFTRWGHAQHTLPNNNIALKAVMLEKLPTPGTSVYQERPMRPTPWLSFTLGGLAIATLIIASSGSPVVFTHQTSAPPWSADKAGETSIAYPDAVYNQGMGREYYPILPRQSDIPITDTRELLRTDYGATLYTRDVIETAQRIQTIVRGFDGRIDGATSSQKYGRISFVVPLNEFDAFRQELKALGLSKLFIETISTENLLPQKQSIEEQQRQTEKSLAEYRQERKKIVASYQNTKASIQSRLNAIAQQLATIRADQSSDPVRRAELAAQEQQLLKDQSALNTRLVNENATYQKQLAIFDANIKSMEGGLEYLATQDKNLLHTTATVRGTISLTWISIWGIIGIYVSPYGVPLFLALATGIAYTLHRRRYSIPLYTV